MAITLLKEDTTFEGMGSDGKRTAIRHMVFDYSPAKDSQMDLANSELLPSLHDVHPDYAGWRAESISKPEYFDNPPRYIVDVTYSFNSNDNGLGYYNKEKKPWDDPYNNIQISAYDKEITAKQWFDAATGEPTLIANTAGDAIPVTDTINMFRITFQKNYKSKKNKLVFDMMESYSLNDQDIQVFGMTIRAYCGKLLPFSIEKHVVVDGKGKEKYVYDTVNFTIEVAPYNEDLSLYGWKKTFLNVGTRARFYDPESREYYVSRIYSFRKIEKYNRATYPADIAQAELVYGSLQDLITARQKFMSSSKEATSSLFPYEEVTEPMPLTTAGTEDATEPSMPGMIDLNALETKKYGTIAGYMRKGESWAKYGFPRRLNNAATTSN